MLRLIPFFLTFAVLAAPATADSVWNPGGATGTLVGAFDEDVQGQFVQATWNSTGAVIDIPGARIAIEMALEAPEIVGPLANFGNLQLHDNRYGWIHFQGAASIATPVATVMPRGVAGDGWYLTGLDLTWILTNGTLQVQASDAVLSNDPRFQSLGPEPGAWALLQGGSGTTMDWLALGGAPFNTSEIAQAPGAEVVMNVVGTLGDGAPDLLVRLEESGHFIHNAGHYVLRSGTLAAAKVPGDALAQPRGQFMFHERDGNHTMLEVRLPTGLSGEWKWQQDTTRPHLVATHIQNVTPYAPNHQIPELMTTWNEPVWAELQIGELTKVAVHASESVRFRLTGLQPETTYTYTLRARDLAGNLEEAESTFRTGPAPPTAGEIQVTKLAPFDWGTRVFFLASSADGEAAPLNQIHVFIDKTPSDNVLGVRDGQFSADVPADAHELRIELTTPNGRTSESIQLGEPTESTPGPIVPGLCAVVLLAAAARRQSS